MTKQRTEEEFMAEVRALQDYMRERDFADGDDVTLLMVVAGDIVARCAAAGNWGERNARRVARELYLVMLHSMGVQSNGPTEKGASVLPFARKVTKHE